MNRYRFFNQVPQEDPDFVSPIEGNILKFKQKRRENNEQINYKIILDKAKDSAEIQIYDMIGAWGISAKNFAKDLKSLGDVKTLNVRISSDGGDVFDGRTIFT